MGLRLVPSFDHIKVKSDLDSKIHKGALSPSKKQMKSPEQRVADVRISESAVRNKVKEKREKSSREIEELDVVDIREGPSEKV